MSNIDNSNALEGIISSPGRICLFGEHQDYLGLPVIPMAIDRRLYLYYWLDPKKSMIQICSDSLPRIEKISHTDIGKLTGTPYDYIKAVFKFYDNSIAGKILPSELKIRSSIPIKSGLSSSAALLVSTVFLVANIVLQKNLTLDQIADVAFHIEHDVLGISCGRMDQTCVSFGGIFQMTTTANLTITPLTLPVNSFFVIGDSEIVRHADTPLKHVQNSIFNILETLGNPDLQTLPTTSSSLKKLTNKEERIIQGILGVRENEKLALKELQSPIVDLTLIGSLLDEQHHFLRDNYQVSNPKIDEMCKVAKESGALGAKMTGAGFGGCMFALTDSIDAARKIRAKLAQYGQCYIVQPSEGVKKESVTRSSF
ncbi:hypothetical protein CEE45_11315 [Candidatus Heimdallarchaeota archaeon B3_Heim]|nr:MAG: hypothetical protein CEE45_11315 [Candidatus Heimdallarchaeota archaeon B3_Heim]